MCWCIVYHVLVGCIMSCIMSWLVYRVSCLGCLRRTCIPSLFAHRGFGTKISILNPPRLPSTLTNPSIMQPHASISNQMETLNPKP
jgi:hypothetical protein